MSRRRISWSLACTMPALVCFALGSFGCKSEKESPLLGLARANEHRSDLAHPIPIFNVRSLRDGQRYFRDVLGFRQEWEVGEPPDFGSVSRGETRIFLCQRCQGRGGAWIMTFAPDVDRLYRELREKKALIRMPPTDMPWKLREMRVADPDGNMLRFASQIEH